MTQPTVPIPDPPPPPVHPSASQVHVDLVVIGFGKGSKTLAAALGRRGWRVVMVEQSAEMYGGTCINIGCVPTKSLVYQSEHLADDERGADSYRRAVSVQTIRS